MTQVKPHRCQHCCFRQLICFNKVHQYLQNLTLQLHHLLLTNTVNFSQPGDVVVLVVPAVVQQAVELLLVSCDIIIIGHWFNIHFLGTIAAPNEKPITDVSQLTLEVQSSRSETGT